MYYMATAIFGAANCKVLRRFPGPANELISPFAAGLVSLATLSLGTAPIAYKYESGLGGLVVLDVQNHVPPLTRSNSMTGSSITSTS